ncbi:MAG: DUF1320 domain-containing protein [Pseudomonadota bacterium]
MPYATLANLIERFGELELTQLTDAASPGLIDEAVVARALADAEAVVDGHLGGRYTLPLATVPPVLVGAVCDLARARLYKDALPEVVAKRADEAMKYLTLLGQGKITLGMAPEPVSTRDARIVSGARRREGIGL